MQALLASGVDANLRDNTGCTALHLIYSHYPACSAVIEALLEHGADTEAQELGGCTALHNMALHKMTHYSNYAGPSIDVLVSGGAAIEARAGFGRTPLHCASAKHKLPAMRALLRSGADLQAKENTGRSPLHVVVRSSGHDGAGVAEVVDLLLRWGADETTTIEPPSDDSDDSDDSHSDSLEKTVADVWEHYVEDHRISAAGPNPVRKLLADAQKDRTCRRRGWLMLVRAFRNRVRLKAENRSSAAITGRAQSVRATGVAAAASDGAQADSIQRRERPIRGLSGVVAGVVGFQEDGVFRNIVKFL